MKTKQTSLIGEINLSGLAWYITKNVWQLRDAKNKFSQVANCALVDGPQIVTKRGIKSIVIMSIDEYKKLRKS